VEFSIVNLRLVFGKAFSGGQVLFVLGEKDWVGKCGRIFVLETLEDVLRACKSHYCDCVLYTHGYFFYIFFLFWVLLNAAIAHLLYNQHGIVG
jgi:hypothetical protein